MTTPPLDPKKLLGFKLIPHNPSEPATAISIKRGDKGPVIQLGNKAGAKEGGKVMGAAQHR